MKKTPLRFALAFLLTPAGPAAAAPRRPAPPPAPAVSSPAADTRPALDAARRALAEGLPTVAAHRLAVFLQGSLPPAPEARREADLLLARALLAAGEPQAALDALPADEGNPTALFWRGQVHAALGRWEEALRFYEEAAGAPAAFPEREAARFGRAEALRALRRPEEAARGFEELAGVPGFAAEACLLRAGIALEAGQPEAAGHWLEKSAEAPGADAPDRARAREYLGARLLLARGRAAEAEAAFAGLVNAAPRGFTERLLAAAHLGWAESRQAQGRMKGAEDVLEGMIERWPRNPFLTAKVFPRLQALYAQDATADFTELARWARNGAEPARQAPAVLLLARARRREGRPESAEQMLAGFAEQFPAHPLRARVWLELADLQLARDRPAEARASLGAAREAVAEGAGGESVASLRRELDELDARASLAQGDFAAAARRFETLAARPGATPAEAEAAAVQAALARLRAGDEEGFAAARVALARRFPNSPWRTELPLEEGLIRAANAGAFPWTARAAEGLLRRYLRERPDSARAPEARLALAEIAWGNADAEGAGRELRAVANGEGDAPPLPEATAERAEALAIWLADAPGPSRDEAAAIAKARAFLARWPESRLAAEVRLKLGEIYFRREDYPDAQTELELVSADAAAPGQYESARYLAGLAALRGLSPAGADRAVGLFEDAARLGGPLKLAARLRQAETLRDRLGKPMDALLVYDAVLAAAPVGDAETRCAALCGKGETQAPAAPAEAAGFFAQAAAVPGASLLWRRQALSRQGDALEQAGNTTAALAAYDDALNATAADPAGAREPEFTWFYRAGFSAARLLKEDGHWRAAIAVYQKLGALDGPLRAEAEAQARQLRLEHFIWNDQR